MHMNTRIGNLKNHFVAALGEFVGTFLFLFFAYGGTQTANQPAQRSSSIQSSPDLTQLLYISLIFGFSLAINVWIFFRVSGGLFNPAVTLALCLVGVVGPIRSIFIFIAQIVASIAAAAAVHGLLPGENVLFSVALNKGTSVAQGVFLEMFFTIELVFTILMLAAEKTKATFVAPVGIGLALFVAELMGVFWTGGALNPARAFGSDVIGGFTGYHWIYWVGPLLGATLAAGFYKLIKLLDYEEVNGSQDLSADEEEEKAEKEREEKRRKEANRGRFHHGRRAVRDDTYDLHDLAPPSSRRSQVHDDRSLSERRMRERRTSQGRPSEGRPSTSPSYIGHTPSGDQGSFRPSVSGAGPFREPNLQEPRSQYNIDGERYLQDHYAQDRMAIKYS